MNLLETILSDRKTAFKQRETQKKDILGFLKAQIQNKSIELGKDPDDDTIISLIKKEIKTRKESIVFLEQQDNHDDVAFEKQNIAYLSVYLPAVMSPEATKEKLLEMIQHLGITDLQKQRGQLMGAMMKQYGSSIDGAVLNEIVTQML